MPSTPIRDALETLRHNVKMRWHERPDMDLYNRRKRAVQHKYFEAAVQALETGQITNEELIGIVQGEEIVRDGSRTKFVVNGKKWLRCQKYGDAAVMLTLAKGLA